MFLGTTQDVKASREKERYREIEKTGKNLDCNIYFIFLSEELNLN